MDSTLKIQEEFEVLVSELEKLRNINQLTTTNTENAEKTINEIASFVKSVDVFKNSIENNYSNTKKELDNAVVSFSESISSINKNTAKQSDTFLELLKSISDKLAASNSKKVEELNIEVEKYTKSLSEIKSENTNTIRKLSSSLLNDLKAQNVDFFNKINSLNIIINSNYKKLSEKQAIFEDKIFKKIEAVENITNKESLKVRVEIEKISTENKQTKMILIISVIIIITLIIALFIKTTI
ncbi:hypothetical protein [Tenacibaculum piscium]|uniref:hypothetical protein n=1 Tax=Tenacibaculum piscium TaxID=1458515 RepID=UPI001F268EB7|nr:hypothetical protein [Tenacibaculum piscium]